VHQSRFTPAFEVASLATPEQCLEALAELDEEMVRIEGHLGVAITRRELTGERADPEWFRRAKSALRHKGRLRQRVQERLGALRRAERQANGVSSNAQAQAFRYAAKRLLPPETIAAIEDAAIARMRQQGALGQLPDAG
jgi:hypothetical protein